MDFSDWLPLAPGGAVIPIGLIATGTGLSQLARPRTTGRIIRVEDRRTSRHQPARWIITYEFTGPDGATHRGTSTAPGTVPGRVIRSRCTTVARTRPTGRRSTPSH